MFTVLACSYSVVSLPLSHSIFSWLERKTSGLSLGTLVLSILVLLTWWGKLLTNWICTCIQCTWVLLHVMYMYITIDNNVTYMYIGMHWDWVTYSGIQLTCTCIHVCTVYACTCTCTSLCNMLYMKFFHIPAHTEPSFPTSGTLIDSKHTCMCTCTHMCDSSVTLHSMQVIYKLWTSGWYHTCIHGMPMHVHVHMLKSIAFWPTLSFAFFLGWCKLGTIASGCLCSLGCGRRSAGSSV